MAPVSSDLNAALGHLPPDGRTVGERELGNPIARQSEGAPDVRRKHGVHGAGVHEEPDGDRPPAWARSTHLARDVCQRHRQRRS